MPPPAEDSPNLRFDVFTLDLRAVELYKSGHKIKLQEQPFRILAMLLEQPGQVVTREQLRARLWPEDTFVDFDHSLNTAVKKLRQALNDEADKPRFIETLPRRGYRFVGPTLEGPQAPQPSCRRETGPIGDEKPGEFAAKSTSAAAVTPLPGTRWKIVTPVVILILAVGAAAYFFSHINHRLTEKDTIVIADFSNSTGDPV